MTEVKLDAPIAKSEVWNGFHFPMGFFILTTPRGDGKNRVAFGKIDPVTKEMKKWTEVEFDD